MGSIKIKGATSGSMVLTVPDTGSDNVPVNVDSLLEKTGDGSGLSGVGTGKNLIINGGFDVWQRGTSFNTNGYTADRWSTITTGASVSKESITDLPGFSSALKLTTGAADPYFVQKVEGTYFRGQTMTLSFWAKGAVPPHTMLYDYTNTYSNQTPILIDTVGAWKRYSNTYVLPTTTPTRDYLKLRIDLAESSSSIQYLTGIQVELGSVATNFEHRSYGEELALCKRYYDKFAIPVGQVMGIGMAQSANNAFMNFQMQEMRVTPSVSSNGGLYMYTANTQSLMVGLGSIYSSGSGMYTVAMGTLGGFVEGRAVAMLGVGSTAFLYFDAEL